ncbi:hypothetical protein BZG36_01924 [Bifiguratus adelaidae]|uniref:T-box domain-containing protein n=1 Tax=Bifiguratus adelaidae TaxID=1938954 RepID=A0A261Y4I9_9FUNG|nr:hypothetical protein BZG36_01924 [Bifiguratus adelaidae]
MATPREYMSPSPPDVRTIGRRRSSLKRIFLPISPKPSDAHVPIGDVSTDDEREDRQAVYVERCGSIPDIVKDVRPLGTRLGKRRPSVEGRGDTRGIKARRHEEAEDAKVPSDYRAWATSRLTRSQAHPLPEGKSATLMSTEHPRRSKVTTSTKRHTQRSSPIITNATGQPISDPLVDVTLVQADLWHQFHQHQNEMIITRSGRCIFPSLEYRVANLDPKATYTFGIDILQVSPNRHRWRRGRWESLGEDQRRFGVLHHRDTDAVKPFDGADVHLLDTAVYWHPEGPKRGAEWMGDTVAFSQIKVSNRQLPTSKRKQSASAQDGTFLLNSFHVYQPRLHILQYEDDDRSDARVLTYVFEETEFIAVTHYQNDKVNRLKKDYNPHAKGFKTLDKANERLLKAIRARRRRRRYADTTSDEEEDEEEEEEKEAEDGVREERGENRKKEASDRDDSEGQSDQENKATSNKPIVYTQRKPTQRPQRTAALQSRTKLYPSVSPPEYYNENDSSERSPTPIVPPGPRYPLLKVHMDDYMPLHDHNHIIAPQPLRVEQRLPSTNDYELPPRCHSAILLSAPRYGTPLLSAPLSDSRNSTPIDRHALPPIFATSSFPIEKKSPRPDLAESVHPQRADLILPPCNQLFSSTPSRKVMPIVSVEQQRQQSNLRPILPARTQYKQGHDVHTWLNWTPHDYPIARTQSAPIARRK